MSFMNQFIGGFLLIFAGQFQVVGRITKETFLVLTINQQTFHDLTTSIGAVLGNGRSR